MEIEENENNLTVMVVDGRLKYYQKKDADKLLNQQQKEIEQLKELLAKHTIQLSETLEENTKLKEQLKECEEMIKEAINLPKGVEPHSYSDYKQLLTKKQD